MVRLSPELERYIEEQLASGAFATREDLITEALRTYRDLEQDDDDSDLRELVAERLAQAERGEVMPMDLTQLKADLVAEFEAQKQKKAE